MGGKREEGRGCCTKIPDSVSRLETSKIGGTGGEGVSKSKAKSSRCYIHFVRALPCAKRGCRAIQDKLYPRNTLQSTQVGTRCASADWHNTRLSGDSRQVISRTTLKSTQVGTRCASADSYLHTNPCSRSRQFTPLASA